jgi:hypothetical protein
MSIDRRTFGIGMAVAICGAALPAMAATNPSAASPYRHRLRFIQKGSKFDFWVRVSKSNQVSADVPFTLVLSSDAAGQVVLQKISHVSHSASSHIARGSVDLASAGWSFGTPLYGHVVFDNGAATSKVRRLGPPPPRK